ncbi:MAG: hypothetical protein AB8B78_11595 [Polaribacter sp.]
MKHKIFYCLFFISLNFYGSSFLQKQDSVVVTDTIVYNKTIEYAEKRAFTEDLKEKYADDKAFKYTEEVEKEPKTSSEENRKNSQFFASLTKGFIYFISNIFPFLLGLIIVFIILKTFLGSEINFWKFGKKKTKTTKKLVYEGEDINETDIEGLLQKAIHNKQYKLAVRYYYLSVLKQLSDKKLIDYHKDKTNSEYLFEIENKDIRTQFSYLSYVFSYVWYGDFPIDETNFKLAEKKYKSFKTTLR